MSNPCPWNTIPEALRAQRRDNPQAIILHDGDVEMSVDELADRAQTMARALQSRGIKHGDRVGVWAPNCWQWVVAAMAIWDSGAIIVPLNTRGKGIETADVLRRTGCAALFMVDDFLGSSYVSLLADTAGNPTEGRAFDALPELRTVVTLTDARTNPNTFSWNEFESLAEATPVADAERTAQAVRGDDLFEILMTSGTTGEPKGVTLTGGQILRAYWEWSDICGVGEGDRMPVVSPFAHGFGINAGIVACLLRGATIVPIAVFDPDAALDLVDRLRLTVLAGPPNLFSSILSHPDLANRGTSTLRWAIVGAASVPEELVRAMYDGLGFERVTNAYGLIEGSVVTMTRPGDSPQIVACTAGRPIPGMEVRLRTADGADVATGAEGEVQVRGYGVMQGYWDNDQLTDDAFTADGWLRTGDVGVADAHGNLRLVGRTKEMMIVGGFNAYPAEIESLLLHHPALGQAAVVGVPDDRLGEVPVAFVTVKPGHRTTSPEVVSWARAHLSNYKAPRRVTIVDNLPVTPNGKIAKGSLTTLALDLVGEHEPAESAAK